MKYFFFILTLVLVLGCRAKKEEAVAKPDVFYTCSMHPQVHEDRPGKCPICKMDLIPVMRKSGSAGVVDEIELTELQVQLGNIHTDTIHNSAIGYQVILAATLSIDQSKEQVFSSRIMGRIDKLYFKSLGDYVAKGSKLFDLYSEELNNGKQEYLLALEKQKKMDGSIIDYTQLVEAAKNKLLLWGMDEAQIGELAKTQQATPLTTFYSDMAGYITGIDIREGNYVQEGGTVVRLADLSTLWAEAQVYASQLSFIERGSRAIVRFPDMEGKNVEETVGFINPEINPDTRINLIRVSIPNPANRLKPGMAAYVVVQNKKHHSLSLPIGAVIRDSKGASVWVQTSARKFKYIMVEIGIESNDRIEITSGLDNGDVVVTSGAYLLNSEYVFKVGANPMEGMKM